MLAASDGGYGGVGTLIGATGTPTPAGPATLTPPRPVSLGIVPFETTTQLGFVRHPTGSAGLFSGPSEFTFDGVTVRTEDLFLLGNRSGGMCTEVKPAVSPVMAELMTSLDLAVSKIFSPAEAAELGGLCPELEASLAPAKACILGASLCAKQLSTAIEQFTTAHCPPESDCPLWGKKLVQRCQVEQLKAKFNPSALDAEFSEQVCNTLTATAQAHTSVPKLCEAFLSCGGKQAEACAKMTTCLSGCEDVLSGPACQGDLACDAYVACRQEKFTGCTASIAACTEQLVPCPAFADAGLAAGLDTAAGLHAVVWSPGGPAQCAHTAKLPTLCAEPTYCTNLPLAEQFQCQMTCQTYGVVPEGQGIMDRLILADIHPSTEAPTAAASILVDGTPQAPYPHFPVLPDAVAAAAVGGGAWWDGVAVLFPTRHAGKPAPVGPSTDRMTIGYWRWTQQAGVLTPAAVGNGLYEPLLADGTAPLCSPITAEDDPKQPGMKVPAIVSPHELAAKGCAWEDLPVGIMAANLFGTGPQERDLIIANRGSLPGGIEAFATIYRQVGWPASAAHFSDLWRYLRMTPLHAEPYGMATAPFGAQGAEAVFIAVNVPKDGEYLVFRLHGGADQTIESLAIPVGSHSGALSFGPYGIAAARLNDDAVPDFVVSWARIDYPQILFANHVTVFLSQPDGTYAGKHYAAPPQVLPGKPFPSNSEAQLAAVALGDLNRDGYPDLVVGDQRPYPLADGHRAAYVYVYRGVGSGLFDGVTPQTIRSNVRDNYFPPAVVGLGGVKQIAIDAYQNLGILHGMPTVYRPKPPPEEPSPCADLDGDGVAEAAYFSRSVTCPDNCPGLANPNQQDSDHDGAGDACDEPEDEIVCGDRDSDGVLDTPIKIGQVTYEQMKNKQEANPKLLLLEKTCLIDNCNPFLGNVICQGPEQDVVDPDGGTKKKNSKHPCSNVSQKDSDGDGKGDICDIQEAGKGLPPLDGKFIGPIIKEVKDEPLPPIGDKIIDSIALQSPPCGKSPLVNVKPEWLWAGNDPDGDGIPTKMSTAAEKGNMNICSDCGLCDNCAAVANPNQADSDHDGIGDACELIDSSKFRFKPLPGL